MSYSYSSNEEEEDAFSDSAYDNQDDELEEEDNNSRDYSNQVKKEYSQNSQTSNEDKIIKIQNNLASNLLNKNQSSSYESEESNIDETNENEYYSENNDEIERRDDKYNKIHKNSDTSEIEYDNQGIDIYKNNATNEKEDTSEDSDIYKHNSEIENEEDALYKNNSDNEIENLNKDSGTYKKDDFKENKINNENDFHKGNTDLSKNNDKIENQSINENKLINRDRETSDYPLKTVKQNGELNNTDLIGSQNIAKNEETYSYQNEDNKANFNEKGDICHNKDTLDNNITINKNYTHDNDVNTNLNNKGLEPKLPPLLNIKTVGQASPNSRSPRPQPLLPMSPSPSSTKNTTMRIIPPPQRRRSPLPRKRQINTPRDNSTFRRNYDIIQPEPLSEEENRLISRIMKGDIPNFDPNDPNSLDLINKLLIHLQQLRKQKAKERNYNDGKKLNNAISILERQRNELQIKINQAQSLRLLDADYAEFVKRKEEFDLETKRMIDQIQKEKVFEQNELKRNHELKEKELLEDWSGENRLRMYNKSSNGLTSLRRQQAFLLIQNKFDEAQKLGIEIDQRQMEEMRNHHNEHQKDYDSAYDRLIEKNKEEEEFLENKYAIKMATLIQNRNKEKRALENKEKWLISKKSEIKDGAKLGSKTISPGNSPSRSFSYGMSSRSDTYRKPILPSSKMTRNELGGSDVVIYKLPKIVNRRDTKGKITNRKK
ncbi:hypothetical protein M9Y10_016457 [Tritrichomonas musculus]|uniref:Uncharacterized protein n=1 Tax=Tritrichomonas musculus TaxID=1915356 RepID=A0ABR2HWM8_9EUKA